MKVHLDAGMQRLDAWMAAREPLPPSGGPYLQALLDAGPPGTEVDVPDGSAASLIAACAAVAARASTGNPLVVTVPGGTQDHREDGAVFRCDDPYREAADNLTAHAMTGARLSMPSITALFYACACASRELRLDAAPRRECISDYGGGR